MVDMYRSRCLLTFSALMFSAITLQAEDQASEVSRQLAVGESVKVVVVAKTKFNRCGVKIAEGEHYSFTVAEDARWKDLNIECDAGGWTTDQAPKATQTFIKLAEKKRRVPAANWFELIGTIGEDEKHHFQIGKRGSGWTFTATTDGELYLFANDLISMYGNNHDSVEVTIMRMDQQGEHSLPSNPDSKD